MRYKLRGVEYEVTDTVDKEADYLRIQELAPVDTEYKQRMLRAAISLNVLKDGIVVGLIYVENKEHRSNAVSIWSKDILGMMILWAHIYCTTNVRQMLVVPHNKEDVKMYISIATGGSIRRYHNGARPYLIIDMNKLSSKYSKYVEIL